MISLERARTLIAATRAKGREMGLNPLTIVVLDAALLFEKNWYQLELLEQRQDHRGLQNIKYDGPLHLEVIFGLPMHVTWSGIKKTRNEGMCHSLKPDVDNLIKFLVDACNGILYEDDKQIAIVYATKIWTQKPRTEFTLTFLGNEQLVNK